MDKLPKVYANPINKKLNNIQEFYRSDDRIEQIKSNPKDVIKKIDEIFSSSNHIYKSHVLVTLKDKEFLADIVGKTNTGLLTLDGKLIKITDIIDIKKV